MSTIAEVRLPAAEFVLGAALDESTGVEFEFVRSISAGMPTDASGLWVRGDGLDRTEEALRRDDSVATIDCLTRLQEGRLYRVEWSERSWTFPRLFETENAWMLRAVGSDGEWRLRLLFPDREALSAANRQWTDAELSLTVDSIHELRRSLHEERFGLTESQHTALVSGFDAGYYDIPRKTNIDALAEQLGISHQALSERFRRGHAALVKNTLINGSRLSNP